MQQWGAGADWLMHDPEAVAAFADRMVVLDGGRIALEGTPRDLFHRPGQLAALGVAIR